jgi:hydrogenase maturation factor
MPGDERSGFFRPDLFFDGHVFEFAGFKDIAALLAFYKFSVVVAGYNPHTRVLAGFLHNCRIEGDRLTLVGIWIEP